MTDQQIQITARKEAHELDLLIYGKKSFEIESLLTNELIRFIRVLIIEIEKD